MKIFAIDYILNGVTMEKIMPHLKEEALHAWKLMKEEKIREIYFRKDHPGVVVVLEAGSIDEAKAIMSDLPLVREKLIEFDYIPVGAFLPLEGLFAKEK